MSVRQHKKKEHRGRRPGAEPSGGVHDPLLGLVRDGVRKFILDGARISEFQKTLNVVARRGKESHHPLTGVVFRRIVKEAIRERRRRTSHR